MGLVARLVASGKEEYATLLTLLFDPRSPEPQRRTRSSPSSSQSLAPREGQTWRRAEREDERG